MSHQHKHSMVPDDGADVAGVGDTPVQLLFDSMATPAWLVAQASGAVLAANQAATRRYGYSRAEFLAMRLDDLRASDDGADGQAVMHRTRDGQTIAVELEVHGAIYQGGPARLVLGRDVTAQLRAAEGQARAADRVARLQAVTAALAETLTPEQVAAVAIDSNMAVLGAYAGSLAMLTEDHSALEVINAIGYTPDLVRQFQRFPSDTAIPLADAAREGRPILLESRQSIEARYPILAAAGLGARTAAMASIPLIAGGRTIGGLGFSFAAPRRFEADDQAFMLALARQCAQALDRAQLYAAERQAHAVAEAARQRESFLAGAGVLLAASLDYQATLKNLARIAVPTLADLCTVHILTERGGIEQIAVAHRDPSAEQFVWDLEARYPARPDDPRGLPHVIRSGRAEVFLSLPDPRWEGHAHGPEHLALLRQLRISAWVCLPLVARGHTLGTMTFMMTADSGRSYTPDTLHTAEELTRRAAQAIDNALLYQAAQQAAQLEEQHAGRLRRLAEASLTINSARTTDAMLTTITAQARALIGARYAATSLLAEESWDTALVRADGDGHYIAARGQPWQPHGGGVYDQVCRDGAPLRLSRAEWAARHPAVEPAAAGGWLGAPLVRRDGRSIGLIALFDKAGGDFSAEDEVILVQLAQLAAIALENLRLYDEAQAAIRARNEVLSLVSHDLKNPLGVIKGYAQHLQRRAARIALPEIGRLTEGLAKIEVAADKMAVLIGEFLDVARLQTGDLLDLDRSTVDLAALVTQVVTEHQQAGNHRFQLQLGVASLPISGDAARLERVLANLLSNASKYSPSGSLISVGLEQAEQADGAWAVLSVADQGIGIPADDLPYIFERFRRASNVTGHIRGSGIGLASARQIVEQHGGMIAAASEEGRGSVFTVRLPLAGR